MRQKKKKTLSYEAPYMESYYIKHSILLHSLSGDATISDTEDGEYLKFVQ